nr:MAG: wsv442-like protein [Marsupenaeus japonicus pemonivirus]
MQREYSIYAGFSDFPKGRGGVRPKAAGTPTDPATAAAAAAAAATAAERTREDRFNALVAPGLLISISDGAFLLTSSTSDYGGDACAHVLYSGSALPSALDGKRSAIENVFGLEMTPMSVMTQIQEELVRSNAIFISHQISSVTIDAGSILFGQGGDRDHDGGVGWLRGNCDPVGLESCRVTTLLSMLPKQTETEKVASASDRHVVIADVISLLIAVAIETARLTKGKLMYVPDGHCLFLAIRQEELETYPHGSRRFLRLVISDPMGCGWRILGKDPFAASAALGKAPMDLRYRVNFWIELATKCVCTAVFRSPAPEQLRVSTVSTGQCPSKWSIIPDITLRVWTTPLASQTDLAKTRVSAEGRLTVTVTSSTEGFGQIYSPPIGAWLSGPSSTVIGQQHDAESGAEFNLTLGPPGNRLSVEPKFPMLVKRKRISRFTKRRLNQRRLAAFYSPESEENGGMLTVSAKASTSVDGPDVSILEKLSLCLSSLMVHKYMWSAVKRHPSWTTELFQKYDASADPKSPSLAMDMLEGLDGMALSPVFLSGGFRRERLSYEMWMIGKGDSGLRVLRITKKSTADGNVKELTVPIFSTSSLDCLWRNRTTATWSAPGGRYVFTPRCLHHTRHSSVHVYDEHGGPPAGFKLSRPVKRYPRPEETTSLIVKDSQSHWSLAEDVQVGRWIELNRGSHDSILMRHPLAAAAVTMAITGGRRESCYILVDKSRKSRIVDLPLQASSATSFAASLMRMAEGRDRRSPERPSEISYVKTVRPESYRVRISQAQYPQEGTAPRDPCPSEMELTRMLDLNIRSKVGSVPNKFRAGGIKTNPGICETMIIDVL